VGVVVVIGSVAILLEVIRRWQIQLALQAGKSLSLFFLVHDFFGPKMMYWELEEN
jgi:hypothetical protein